MEKIIYIVHCIDAEGPLSESIEATFERIYTAFGIKIEPSYENLKKLQNKELYLSGKEEAVANLVSPEKLNNSDSWNKIDINLEEITTDEFRNEFVDSFEGGWIYNWFCLDHVGFTGENPRRRDIGYHNIYDHYKSYMEHNNCSKDMIQWHFHPPSLLKDAHRSGTSYVSSSLPFEILSRKIIDRLWFPTAFRPGFHTERPDSNWFLEQWIPFDYANQATKETSSDQPDVSYGRFGDWRKSPKEWKIYHPDHDDYQLEGKCRRWIARCLNIEARHGQITIDDLRDGFKRAESSKPTLISFTNHDFRDIKTEIIKIRNMIKIVSEEYPNVKFKYCNAVEGMRKAIGIMNLEKPDFNIKIEHKHNSTILKIKSKNDIFGPQPFFAIKTKTNHYYWENLDFQNEHQWSYTFDFNTFNIDAIDNVGIAANTKNGVTEVVVVDVSTNKIIKNILNQNPRME